MEREKKGGKGRGGEGKGGEGGKRREREGRGGKGRGGEGGLYNTAAFYYGAYLGYTQITLSLPRQ